MEAPKTQTKDEPTAQVKTSEQRRRTSMEQAKAIEDEYERIINGE